MKDTDRKFLRNRYIPVEGDLGVTENIVAGPDNWVQKVIINAVRQHEPTQVVTDAGVVKNNTLTRITRDNFSTVEEARKFIKDLIGKEES